MRVSGGGGGGGGENFSLPVLTYNVHITSTVGHSLVVHVQVACSMGHHHRTHLPELGLLHSTDMHAHLLPAGTQPDPGRI